MLNHKRYTVQATRLDQDRIVTMQWSSDSEETIRQTYNLQLPNYQVISIEEN